MSDEPRPTRRRLIALGAAAGAGWLGARAADAASVTPEQTEGPFFPHRKREDEDFDLTRVRGRSGRAAGDVVYVRGRILDENGEPIDGAHVEIWQANAYGRYDHERDGSNPRPLDPNFQGWARLVTGPEGRYGIKTIRPGGYPVGPEDGPMRPPHLHFKISRRGFHELTTQMYFAGEPKNQRDGIYRSLSDDERAAVTVRFAAAPDIEKNATLGTFDVTLRRAV